MPKKVYDTRFLIELYYTKNQKTLQKIQTHKRQREKYISTIVIHEIHKLTLMREGRETATLRTTLLKKDFQTIPIDTEIAQTSAELRHRYNLPMGDSIIAATAQKLKATCISDDQHFRQIKEIKTTWI
jgi:predicted nucleic acid-binding protein